MNTFAKKNEVLFLSIALVLLAAGTVFSLFTQPILEQLPSFLEEHVFHRTFNYEKFKDTMVSLLQFPVFIAILFSAIVFVKFSDRSKSALIITSTFLVMLVLAVISFKDAVSYTYQDLSSEILFSKECFDHKTFWPVSWFYSMEFRFINTQILTAPFFLFTKDLRIIRAIQVVLSEAVLYISTYFIMHELRIKKLWIKLLCCLLAISPVSWSFFSVVQEGSYYIPHIAFSFFYVGLFLRIAYNSSVSLRKERALRIVFLVLAFLSGLSTIRYILNFTFPLAAILVYNRIKEFVKDKRAFSFKEFFLEDKPLLLALEGLLLSGVGYIFNSLVIASVYTFKNMNKVRFNSISEMKVDDIIAMVLYTIGYNENVSFSTPGGVSNVLLLVASIFTAVVFANLYNKDLEKRERIFLQFTAFMAAFSLYTNVCIEMTGRYLTIVVIYFAPFLAVALQNQDIAGIKKWILGASSAVLVLTNAFLCFGRMQTENDSENLQKVSSFLLENGYEFGYAFSNAANPIWFITNGKIEAAQLTYGERDGANTVPDKYSIHKWLEPKKFLDENYYKGGKNVFFTLSKEEFDASKDSKALEKGRLVYNDGNYLVFDYNSQKDFISSFDEK